MKLWGGANELWNSRCRYGSVAITVVFGLSCKRKASAPQNTSTNRPSNKQMKEFSTNERTKNFFRRPPSFSFVLFKGDVSKDIPKLLERCGYKVLESSVVKTNFPDLYANLPAQAVRRILWFQRPIVASAAIRFFANRRWFFSQTAKSLRNSARNIRQKSPRQYGTSFRDSFSSQIAASGVTSQTFYIAGKVEGEQKQPHKLIQDNPSDEGLLHALAD